MGEDVCANLRVGVHWDTEVKGGAHRVCQVFCSALPISFGKGTKKDDWKLFATAVLNGTYEATLAAGAILAGERRERVTVYLTKVGGGAFGNPSQWIIAAIERALKMYASAPIDVKLVNFGKLPN